MNTEKQPNILVVRFSSLGDIVLSSPVYKNIKAAWPNARITLLVKPAFSQALAGHPDIDEILVSVIHNKIKRVGRDYPYIL